MFEALTGRRSYRTANDSSTAISQLEALAGCHLDQEIVAMLGEHGARDRFQRVWQSLNCTVELPEKEREFFRKQGLMSLAYDDRAGGTRESGVAGKPF